MKRLDFWTFLGIILWMSGCAGSMQIDPQINEKVLLALPWHQTTEFDFLVTCDPRISKVDCETAMTEVDNKWTEFHTCMPTIPIQKLIDCRILIVPGPWNCQIPGIEWCDGMSYFNTDGEKQFKVIALHSPHGSMLPALKCEWMNSFTGNIDACSILNKCTNYGFKNTAIRRQQNE